MLFTGWMSVTSGALRESVLGSLIFLYLYIGDLDINVDGLVHFEDDTKVSGVADSVKDCQSIHQDIL